MTTATGTITSATPQVDLYTAIEGAFTAHSNWTLVDTAVIATNTYKVWKNHGTGVTDNNSYGTDFYVVLSHTTTGAGSVIVRVCEDVTIASDLMIRPCMEDGTNATASDASGLASTSYSTTTGVATVTITPGVSPNTSDYYIVASKNVLHVALRRSDSATVYSCYAGLFDTRVTIANEFPITLGANVVGITNSASSPFRTSRHPGRISQAAVTTNFAHTAAAMTATSGDTGNVDLFRGKAQAAKVYMGATGGATPANAPTFGRIRGLLYDVAVLPAATGVTLGIGDVLDDISGNNHWYFAYGGLDAWVDQTAV